jgi:hypothetical protein
VELESLGMASPEIPLVASRLIDVAPDETVLAAPYASYSTQLSDFQAFRADSIVVETENGADRVRIVSPAFGQIDIGISGGVGEVATVGPPPWIVRA